MKVAQHLRKMGQNQDKISSPLGQGVSLSNRVPKGTTPLCPFFIIMTGSRAERSDGEVMTLNGGN
jgi:hypothetical protein